MLIWIKVELIQKERDYLVEFESKWRFTRNCIKFQNFLWFCVLYNYVFISYCEKKKNLPLCLV